MANDHPYDYPSNHDRDADGYGRDYTSGRDHGYSSAREYRPAGETDRNFRRGGTGYGGDRQYQGRSDTSGGRESYGAGYRDYYGGSAQNDRGFGQQRFGGDQERHREDRDQGGRPSGGGYGRTPQGYDYQDRGFIARAGDEVRSWFGDEDAERRRDYDQRHDERQGDYGDGSGAATTAYGRDEHYHSWRRGQIDALDRDYHEYRRENAKKFETEFGSWRTDRQTQRQSLSSVKEHMDVVGSDGGHVGTVDKVHGDRIILTKSDGDAGGRHHSIPSRWIQSVDDKVTIAKSADEAHKHWRDEEASGALFGDDHRGQDSAGNRDKDGKVDLNRSFSGTY